LTWLLRPAYFLLGGICGTLLGGFIVASAIREKADAIKNEREILWALVELQGSTIGTCDQIMTRLGLREVKYRK